MRIKEISAGVPMKLPTAPAVMPIAAFWKKLGGFPSLDLEWRKKTTEDFLILLFYMINHLPIQAETQMRKH